MLKSETIETWFLMLPTMIFDSAVWGKQYPENNIPVHCFYKCLSQEKISLIVDLQCREEYHLLTI